MVPVVLSPEVQTITSNAHGTAVNIGADHLDSLHLFLSLLESGTLEGWLIESGIADPSTLYSNLNDEISKLSSSGQGLAEPTTQYTSATRKAAAIASDSRSLEITSVHLLQGLLETDARITALVQSAGGKPAKGHITTSTPTLDQYGRDITRLAREGKLEPIIGREIEQAQIIETLLRRGKNSIVLLGDSGTGKTAIVEKLAQEIAQGNVPPRLKSSRIVELTTTSLVAGTSFRGEFEERLRNIIGDVENAKNVILVFDEFHALLGAGSIDHGSNDAGNILKPALARGSLTCIGITTYEEYRRIIERDSAFARRFERIVVAEPTSEETLAILKGIAPKYARHHDIQIEEDALEDIVKWTGQFILNRHFPDKAIDVLARTCSRAEIQKHSTVDSHLVSRVLSDMLKMPVGDIDYLVSERLMSLEERLNREIIGQNAAISVLAKTVRLSYAGLRNANRPKGIFLFAGPSGVGKTQLARSLARELFNSSHALIRIDMSEYSDKYSVTRLIGAPPGYVGYDDGGQLTKPLRERSHCVVLLDEIEKAHPEIFDVFLQLFDAGRLTDSQGNLADGRNAFFIMTSNLGAESSITLAPSSHASENVYEQVIRRHFRPEFVNRIDHIITFRHLDAEDLALIVERELNLLQERVAEQDYQLTYEPSVPDLLALEARTRDAGARGVQRTIEDMISVPIAEMMIRDRDSGTRWIHVAVDQNALQTQWM